MEISRRTWIAAVKLAVVISVLAALAALAVSAVGSIPDVFIVGVIAIVAFVASWVQTGRVHDAPRSARITFHLR